MTQYKLYVHYTYMPFEHDISDLDNLEDEQDQMEKMRKQREIEVERDIAKRFRAIFRKSTLTEDDKRFLRARRSYLTKAQLQEYDDVLNEKQETIAEIPLIKRSREELNQMAIEAGIDNPEELPNKNEVIKAIEQSE